MLPRIIGWSVRNRLVVLITQKRARALLNQIEQHSGRQRRQRRHHIRQRHRVGQRVAGGRVEQAGSQAGRRAVTAPHACRQQWRCATQP